MTTSIAWIVRVLEKLREHVLSGNPVADIQWQYDSLTNLEEEDKALVFLETVGVLQSLVTDPLVHVDANGNIHYGTSAPRTMPVEHTRVLKSFDADKYADVCPRYGLEPYQELYHAKLELLDGVNPTVIVGTARYTLPTIHSGKSADIIRYCYKYPGKKVSKKELQEQAGVNPLPSVRNVLRTGYFAHRTGILSPFVYSDPDSVTLLLITNLSKDEVDRIRRAALT